MRPIDSVSARDTPHPFADGTTPFATRPCIRSTGFWAFFRARASGSHLAINLKGRAAFWTFCDSCYKRRRIEFALMGKVRKAAIEGWFTWEAEAALIGTRCRSCNTFFFPKETHFCRNPSCQGTAFEEVQLSRSGTLWSYTDNRYAPPPPYVAKDPFQPYSLAAVELASEKMVVLGQVARGFSIDDLRVGMAMDLVIETLFEDEQTEYLVWKWKPALPAGR